jgi:hypothetical protein
MGNTPEMSASSAWEKCLSKIILKLSKTYKGGIILSYCTGETCTFHALFFQEWHRTFETNNKLAKFKKNLIFLVSGIK